jgi:allophanate hydrolase
MADPDVSLDIGSLAAAYAAGARPADVITACHARIAKDTTTAVWIHCVTLDDALHRLELAERRGGAEKLALFGVPFAIKDNIDVAGIATTAGCPGYRYEATGSAVVVARLEAAGAILLGKTNLDQFATGLTGTRSPYGIPSSVFDRDYIAGGSSSGSAVAVASGLVSFALGTDTAGSGRVPASFNNIVGLKPTRGWLSSAGVVPACRTLDCVSIFARTVEDAWRVADIAAGYDEAEPFSREPPEHVEPIPAGHFRFGIPRERIEFFGDGAAEALFAESVARLERLGGEKVAIDFTPFLEAGKMLYGGPWIAERLAAIEDFASEHQGELFSVTRDVILAARDKSAVDTFKAFYRLAGLARRAEGEWKRMDVLLLPTTGTTHRIADVVADPIALNSQLGLYTNFANLLDLCAIAVPAGFRASGLPFGVSLFAPAFRDRSLAALASRLHRALDGATIGATGRLLPRSPTLSAECPASDSVMLALVGAHLSSQPLNGQLTSRGAQFVRTARTSHGYSLYALPGDPPARPGLVFDGKGAGRIEIEIWKMSSAAFGAFVAAIPPPLSIGTLTLEDGAGVKGFLCESHAVSGAENITAHGGWRAFLAQARSH